MVFDETILVTGTRGARRINFTVTACVVDDGQSDAAADSFSPSLVDRFTFFVRKDDWPDHTPPEVGDAIVRERDGAKCNASRVAHLANCFSINARSR